VAPDIFSKRVSNAPMFVAYYVIFKVTCVVYICLCLNVLYA